MSDTGVRIDKWLWAARFFKTRTLAKKALERGNVKVNGQRSRPSRKLLIGASLEIKKGDNVFCVTVLALSEKRRSATLAQQLYEESDANRETRLAAAEKRRLIWHTQPRPSHRPDKRQRRQLQRIKHQRD